MNDWRRKSLLKQAAVYMRKHLTDRELASQVQVLTAIGYTRRCALHETPVSGRLGALEKHEARYVAHLLRKGSLLD